MKKLLISCLCLGALFMAASCEDDNADVAKKYQVTISVTAEGASIDTLTDFTVTLATASGEKVTLDFDSLAGSEFTARVIAGSYTINASAFGGEEWKYSASKTIVVADADQKVELIMKPSPRQESGIIFKEIYYTGVKSFYFQDAFYELVNNSNEVKYLDGLIISCIARGAGKEMSSWADSTGSIPESFYPLDNYVMQFPFDTVGNEKLYPLQPGENIVIATLSLDHTARVLTDNDTPSPSKLDDADWEIFIPTSARDIDNPDIPNLNHIWGSGGYYFMPMVAGQPMALIQLPEGVTAESFIADSTNYHSAPGTTKDVLCVPCEYVIDAVDIQRHGSTQIVKAFHPAQDAGYTFVSGADETAPDYEVSFDSWESPMYCGKSLRRKCILVTDSGRAYFKDTNNSTEDFILGGQRAVVRRSFTEAD